MASVDHAEVRERLQDALLGPGKLAALDAEDGADAVALREHLARCGACRAEEDALRQTAALLALAAPDDLRAPEGARERVLEGVAGTGVVRLPTARGTRPLAAARRWSARSPVTALAAAVALLLLGGGVLLGLDLVAQRDRSAQQARELARIAAQTDRLLARPTAVAITLRAADGTPGGTLIHDPAAGEIVVMSSILEEPAGGPYACYLERGGQRLRVGWMHYANGVAYWAGPMDELADAGRPGDRFVVVVEATEEAVLVGTFGGG